MKRWKISFLALVGHVTIPSIDDAILNKYSSVKFSSFFFMSPTLFPPVLHFTDPPANGKKEAYNYVSDTNENVIASDMYYRISHLYMKHLVN